MYDYLIVGTGFFGAVFACEAIRAGKKVLAVDKRLHIGGNAYTYCAEGINVHRYGPHIFHTDNERVWDYVNRFADFNRFTNSPLADYKGELYNLPFNMNTFYRFFGDKAKTPALAREAIAAQVKRAGIGEPRNLEEQAIKLVGRDIYETLIKGYTEKQWGKSAKELPASIIRRLPLRFTYDNNYFNDRYQGIPIGGYTQIFEKLLSGVDVELGVDYIKRREEYRGKAKKIIYTGMIDEYFDYRLGNLEYRSLRFETKTLDEQNFQGNAVINYTEREVPYTRIIEHKHFEFGTQEKTVVTYEYPEQWVSGLEPYYPVNDQKNNRLYNGYSELAAKERNVVFGGRLGKYRYYDMDKVIEEALAFADKELF